MANLSNINNKFLVTTGGNVLIGQTGTIGSSIFQVTGNSTFAGSVTSNAVPAFIVGTIGAIGNTANDVNIYSTTAGHNGLRMHTNGILPTDNTGTIIDNDADLGDPSYRFKDLYLSGKVVAGTGSTAAATINAYSTTVSAGLHSALRIIENTGASSYWDIGATNGASTILNFYHNAATTPKITFTHLGGATFAGNIKLSSTAGETATPSYIWLGNDYSNGQTRDKLKIYLYNSGTEQYGFSVGNQSDVQYHSNQKHDFYVANSLKVRINTSGNVGIGTDSPGTKLQVNQTNNDIYQLTLHNTHLSTTTKTRIGNWANDSKFSSNYMQSGGTKTQDDATISSWVQSMGGSLDIFDISRSPAGSTTLSSLMNIDSSGLTTIKRTGITGVAKADMILQIGYEGNNGQNNLIGFGYNGASNIPAYIGYTTTSGGGSTKGDLVFATRGVTTNTAPTERMRITSNGQIGFGISSNTIFEYGNSSNLTNVQIMNGNYSILTQQTTNSSASWGVWRNIVRYNGVYQIQAMNDVGTGEVTALQINRSGTTITQVLFPNGNVGIGETAPASKLTVRKDNAGGRGGEISIVNYSSVTIGNEAALNFGLESSTYNADNGNAQIKARVNALNAATDMIFSTWNGGAFGERMRIGSTGRINMLGLDAKGTTGSDVRYRTSDGELYYLTSSKRYKTDIVNLESSLDKINALRPVRFKDIKTGDDTCGLIAEETFEIIPDVVFTKKIEGFDEPQIEGLNYSDLVPFLIKSIQELKAEIELLKSK